MRTLETVIRLATAHAKLRLSKTVDNQDLDVAAKLLNSCIFQEEADEDKFSEDEDEVVQIKTTSSRSRRADARKVDAVMEDSPSKKIKKEEHSPMKATSKK